MAQSLTYDVAEFCDLYPNHTNKWLAEKYGVPEPMIGTMSARHKVKKSASHIAEQARIRATGRKLSDESKAKMASKAKGRVMSEKTKQKVRETKIKNGSVPKGDKHYKWKGGKPWERFKDPQYIEWRNQVLTRDNYVCQDCMRQCKKSESGLAAHHIKPYSEYPELRLDVNNGVTLCRVCHMARHGKTVPQRKIECGCGCGTLIDAFDKYSKTPRKYVNGHGKRGKTKYIQETILCACGCGLTREKFNSSGTERSYLPGHYKKQVVQEKSVKIE